MALTTGTGLTNQSAVIDAIRVHLAADGWTTVINNGSIGANNIELWMHSPAANNFLGIDMTLGLDSDGADDIDMLLSYLTPTEALLTPPGSPSAGRNSFLRVLGCPNIAYLSTNATGNAGDVYPNGTTLGNTTDAAPVRVDRFNQGAAYLRHWIFTPNGSPLSGQPYYFICVVEVATGVFRTFGAGEGIKLGAGGWTGGLWLDGSAVRAGASAQSRYFAGGDTVYIGSGDLGERAYVLNFDNAHYTETSPVSWNPWLHMSQPGGDDWVTAWGCGRRGLGEDFVERSPANFSGQAIRVPARFYGMNLQDNDGDNRMRPLMEIPDVFHVNISAMTPGDTIEDDSETFLVVPYVSKSGTDNSGDYGFLIRHPDL